MFKKILVCLSIFPFLIYAQENGNGIVLEYNQKSNITYQSYSPIKIKIENNQKNIDYTKVEGIVQSFLSASNSEWVKSDFFDKTQTSAKDEEHFNKIKTCNKEANFVELESFFKYVYNNDTMGIVKFSFNFEGLPFQMIHSLSIIFKEGRWFIYDLPNQIKTTYIFSTLNNNSLIEILDKNQSKNDTKINSLRNKSTINGIVSVDLLFNNIEKLPENEKNKLIDERIWNINAGLNFNKSYKNTSASTVIFQSFAYDKTIFESFDKNAILYKGVKKNLFEGMDKFESMIPLSEKDTLKLQNSFEIESNQKKYVIVKYKLNNKLNTQIIGSNPSEDIIDFNDFLGKIKSNFLKEIIDGNSIRLKELFEYSKGQVNGLNISNVINYVGINNDIFIKEFD